MARYKTGEKAPYASTYTFDGYTDGTWSPTPTPEETKIRLSLDEVFPPIRSANKGAYWRD